MYFSKYQGAGNDFILIDDRSSLFSIDQKFIQTLCERKLGIGADGLILLQEEFRMRIFNSDGKEAAMCGNGLRCLFNFIRELGLIDTSCVIQTEVGHFLCRAIEDKVEVELSIPKKIHWDVSLPFEGSHLSLFVVDSGVPHAVIWVDNIEEAEVEKVGRGVRFHPFFEPEGVNVTFACPKTEGRVAVRTYERGVEGETLSCGTGAVAAGYVGYLLLGLRSEIELIPTSQEPLFVRIDKAKEKAYLIGSANKVFEGDFAISLPLSSTQ